MNFKKWLAEYDEKGFNYYKNMLLGKLNLDPTQGLDQDLNAWEPTQLISMLNGLGEFKQLSPDRQGQVIDQIKNGNGSIGDLIRLMAEPQHRLIGNIE